MSLNIKRLEGGLGAELLSFDASQPFNNETRNQLLAALFEALILIIRDQDLSVHQQIRFTEALGELEVPWTATNTHPEDNRLQIVSNAGREQIDYKTSSQYWHTDRSFVSNPTLMTLLHIRQQPPVGGYTEFADMRRSYDTLPDSMKERVNGLSAYHSYSFRFLELRRQRIPASRALTESSIYPDVIHPLIRVHPVTGRKALFLSELCLSSIHNMSKEESDSLLHELYSHALQEEFRYQHDWKTGDLLIWDNASLVHRAVDIPQEYPRVLHRTAIANTTLMV